MRKKLETTSLIVGDYEVVTTIYQRRISRRERAERAKKTLLGHDDLNQQEIEREQLRNRLWLLETTRDAQKATELRRQFEADCQCLDEGQIDGKIQLIKAYLAKLDS